MRGASNRHSMDVFFVLCLFFLCIAVLFGVLGVSARTNSNIQKSTEENYALRTGILYLSNKLRSFDMAGAVSVGSFGEGDALFFKEELDGTLYETRVYLYDGKLMELYTEAAYPLPADVGTEITEASGFRIQKIGDKLLELSVTDMEGRESAVVVQLHGLGG